MTPRSSFAESIREVFAQVWQRPGPALLALVVGLAIGLGTREVTSSEGDQAVRVAAPARHEPRSAVEPPKPKPKPARPQPGPDDIEARIAAALDAVEAYANQVGDARVGAAIAPLDGSTPPLFAGTVAGGKPWSVMKVPTAAAYLNFKRESENAVSGEATIPDGSPEREGLGLALVQSDNLAIRRRVQEMIAAQGAVATATAINVMLTNGNARPQISAAIDPSIDSLQLGTGDWRLDEAAQWFRQLQIGTGECLGLAPDDRVFLLRQLRAAPDALPWGAASVLDHSEITLKPGWGADGGDYTVGQLVIVGNGTETEGFPSLSGGYVMALMAILPSADPSAFTSGQQHLARLAAEIDEQMGTPGPEREQRFAEPC